MRKLLAIAASAVNFAASCVLGADFTLYNVVPCSIGREQVAANDVIELQKRTGVDIALYSLSLHPEGRPAIDKAQKLVESFRKFKAALAGSYVKAGVLVQSILGHWPRTDKDIEDWTWAVDAKGKKKRFCPDDPGFAEYISNVFAMLAKEHPAFILTDDDVRGYSHDAECFCERHVGMFNDRRGTNYTSDELRKRIAEAKQDDSDYVALLAIQREMIEGVVRRARAAIDSVDPSIPGGICIAGEEHLLWPPLARAMAANGQRPVARTSTSLYLERMSADRLPGCVGRILGFAEYYRDAGVYLLCEADTWPHNLWSKSARSFFTHMTCAAFAGMTGAKTWFVNCHKGDFAVTRRYTDVLAERPRYLSRLAEAVRGSDWEGLAVPCFTNFPNWHMMGNHTEFFIEGRNAGEVVCVPFGIPFSCSRDFDADRTYALSSAAEVSRLSGADLRRMFSHRVVVFGEAAKALSARGLDDLTGVKAEGAAPLFNCERDKMNGAFLSFSKSSGSVGFKCREGAEVLSSLCFRPFAGSMQYDEVMPATVLYRNALGGWALVTQYGSSTVAWEKFSEVRKAWLVSALSRLPGGAPFGVSGVDQDILVLVRRMKDGARLVFAVNLNPEPITRLPIFVPDAGMKVCRLGDDGEWQRVATHRKGNSTVCETPLGFYEAAVFKFAR